MAAPDGVMEVVKAVGEVRTCSRKDCTQQNPQPIENFGRRKGGSKPKSECKTCCMLYMRRRYETNPEKLREISRQSRARNPERAKRSARPYLEFKKSYCEECAFVAIDPCQLDVDHIDGNHHNNEPENLKTLCANCHRLKSKRNRDNLRRYS